MIFAHIFSSLWEKHTPNVFLMTGTHLAESTLKKAFCSKRVWGCYIFHVIKGWDRDPTMLFWNKSTCAPYALFRSDNTTVCIQLERAYGAFMLQVCILTLTNPKTAFFLQSCHSHTYAETYLAFLWVCNVKTISDVLCSFFFYVYLLGNGGLMGNPFVSSFNT